MTTRSTVIDSSSSMGSNSVRSRSRSRSRSSRKIIENEVALPWEDLGEDGRIGKESSVRLISVIKQREPLPSAWTNQGNDDSFLKRSKRYVGGKLRSLSDGGAFSKHRQLKDKDTANHIEEKKINEPLPAAVVNVNGTGKTSVPSSQPSSPGSNLRQNNQASKIKPVYGKQPAVNEDKQSNRKEETKKSSHKTLGKPDDKHSIASPKAPKNDVVKISANGPGVVIDSTGPYVMTSATVSTPNVQSENGTQAYDVDHIDGEWKSVVPAIRVTQPNYANIEVRKEMKLALDSDNEKTELRQRTIQKYMRNGEEQIGDALQKHGAADLMSSNEGDINKTLVAHTSHGTSETVLNEVKQPFSSSTKTLAVERMLGTKTMSVKIEANSAAAQQQVDDFLKSKLTREDTNGAGIGPSSASVEVISPSVVDPTATKPKSKSILSLFRSPSDKHQPPTNPADVVDGNRKPTTVQQQNKEIITASLGSSYNPSIEVVNQPSDLTLSRKTISIPVLVTTSTSESESDNDRGRNRDRVRERPKSYVAPSAVKDLSPVPLGTHRHQYPSQMSSAESIQPPSSPVSQPIINTSNGEVNTRYIDIKKASDHVQPDGHFVVVAIDFGTTFSGYAFCFTRDPESIHMMRKWDGGDAGVINQKVPTTLLLTPEGDFHSFGFSARDFFHDMDSQDAQQWHFFEKFKMTLHNNPDLVHDTQLVASSGKKFSALKIFSHSLRYFKEHALQELSDQSGTKILNEDIRWVITVPAIWKAPAKQFMRQAAYQAGIASPEYPDQLLIALEPEAASIFVRKLRQHQLVPDKPCPAPLSPRKVSQQTGAEVVANGLGEEHFTNSPSDTDDEVTKPSSLVENAIDSTDRLSTDFVFPHDKMQNSIYPGIRYMVVDCGGGTVDITVHEMISETGHLLELHKASGGPYGSLGVDMEFEQLLRNIFGSDFIDTLKTKRPAGWVDLMVAFEARKRAASPFKPSPLNISLPFPFIDLYKKQKGASVEAAIRKYGDNDIRWSSQGMLRLTLDAMRKLFMPTVQKIKETIGDALNHPSVRDIKYMFLVGGFSESPLLQQELRKEFGHLLHIIIPQECSLTVLKGAVCYGLDPTVVAVRKSRMTYGISVLNRFIAGKHPREKLVRKDGADWCVDVFDKFVRTDQSVSVGDSILRSYAPARAGQKTININIYCSEESSPLYVTDPGVTKCGTLSLQLPEWQFDSGQQKLMTTTAKPTKREIQARMIFGDTEIKVTALDVKTGTYVKAAIDFLSR